MHTPLPASPHCALPPFLLRTQMNACSKCGLIKKGHTCMYDLGLAAATEGLAAANAVAGAAVEKEAVAAKAAMEAARSAAAKAAEKAEMAAAAMVMAAAKPPLTLAVPPQPLTHTVQSDGLIRIGSNTSSARAPSGGIPHLFSQESAFRLD